MKYYWTNWLVVKGNIVDGIFLPTLTFEQRVMDNHPFYAKSNYTLDTETTTFHYSLADWKQITVEEYNLYQELNNGTTVSPVPDSHIMD